MPARTNGNTATATSAPSKRFELPALDFKFAPLTEGTDIPPPLPSPIQEEPAAPEAHSAEKDTAKVDKAEGQQAEQTNGASKTNGSHASTTLPPSAITTATKGGVKRPAEDNPQSPTLSNRPGSIRRLFSRNLLNSAYANGEAEAQGNNSMDAGSTRPASRSNGSFMDDRKSKRSSGWFRRLRGGDVPSAPSTPTSNKRTSAMFEEAKKPAGPPPPMIPELSDLEAKDESSFGSDLFKDIK